MSTEIKSDVLEKLERLTKQIKFLQSHDIAVGIPTSETKDEPKQAMIAAKLEYGSGAMPARPFLRQTIAENLGSYAKMMESLNVVDVAETKKGMEIIAKKAQADVQTNMVVGNWAKNSPATYKAKLRKGSKLATAEPRPLIDTGRLRQSIKGLVVKKGIK